MVLALVLVYLNIAVGLRRDRKISTILQLRGIFYWEINRRQAGYYISKISQKYDFET